MTVPFAAGGTMLRSRTAAAYGRNYRRLQQAKASCEPHNLFPVNGNVSPG